MSRARTPAALVAPVALLVGVAWLWWPTFTWLARTWAVHPYYAHGPLVVLVAAGLAWRARAAFTAAPPSAVGLALVAAGAGLDLAAGPTAARPVAALGLLVALAGLAALAGGLPALRAVAFPALVAGLAIPLPLAERVAPWLAAATASASASLAAALGVDVVRTGALLAVGDGVLTVGAPCSGLRSLVALATLAVVLAGLLGGAPHRRVALVAAAVPLALAANGARVTGLLWLADAFGADSGLAFFHGPAGPGAFALATGGLLAVARGLGCDVRLG